MMLVTGKWSFLEPSLFGGIAVEVFLSFRSHLGIVVANKNGDNPILIGGIF